MDLTNFIWHIVPFGFCVWWGISYWRLREHESLLRQAVVPILSGASISRSHCVRAANYIAVILTATKGSKVTIELPLEPTQDQMRGLALLMADRSAFLDPTKNYVLQFKETSWVYSK